MNPRVGWFDAARSWVQRWDAHVGAHLRSVEQAQHIAHRRVPAPVESYVEGGAGTEATLTANLAAVRGMQFLPRVGVTSGPAPDLSTTVLGTNLSVPFLLSPVGFTRMMHSAGDVAGAAAASSAGTIFTLSAMSGHSMEEVLTAATSPSWFQLYFLGGRSGAEQMVARARDLRFGAIVVTMDTPIPGDRRRESRYGLSPPLRFDRRTVTKMAPFVAAHPSWLLDHALDGFQLQLANALGLVHGGRPLTAEDALLQWLANPPTWEDIPWIRDQFGGPVIVKGVVTPADARRAVECGAAAVIVSNHGGRQLDGVPATFAALGGVVDAVGGDVEVLVDGGIRSGADVVKAIALGARAAMIGRAWAYGLCAAGQPGVERILSLIREDVDRTMRLVGAASMRDIDSSIVQAPTAWIR